MPPPQHISELTEHLADLRSLFAAVFRNAVPDRGEAAAAQDNAVLDADSTVESVAAEEHVFRNGTVLLDRFRIERLVGSGGMGEVYEAQDLELSERIALKTIRRGIACDPTSLERFKQELQLARRITHPNVVRVFDFFSLRADIDQAHGRICAFVTMQFLPGVTLSEEIRRNGALDHCAAASIALQVSEGLRAAHQAGIIHRDLKTGNIMLIPVEGDESRAVIMDFGLALTTAAESAPDRLTRTGAVLGTPAYMAPEQFHGGAITPATDIYSFGVVLYEMLTASLPLSRESAFAAAVGLGPDLDAGWHAVIQRCLEYDAAQRYSSAEELAEDVRKLCSASPVKLRKRAHLKAESRRMASGAALLWAGAAVAIAALLIVLTPSRSNHSGSPFPVSVATSLDGLERAPCFSPDGNQIAYEWAPAFDEPGYIYVQFTGAESSPLKVTQPGRNTSPAWSPDGKQIAFLHRLGNGSAEIRQVSPLGGPERVLTTIEGVVEGSPSPSLDWSPDNRWILTVGRAAAGQPDGLLLVDSRLSEKHALTRSTVSAPWGDADPSFSQDGRKIVFVRRVSDSNAELCIADFASGRLSSRPRVIATNRASWFRYPRFMLDGRSIVYTCSHKHMDSTLWRIAASGGEPEQIAISGAVGSLLEPVVSRRCCRLALASLVVDPNIWSVELDRPFGRPAPPHLLIGSSRIDGNPQLSPDGNHVAFFSDRTGLLQIWTARRDGSTPQQLTNFSDGHSGTPRWSPDGKTIAFDSTSDGNPEIYSIDRSGNALKRLTQNPATDFMPSYSPDGRWIYFGSNRSGEFAIWRMRPDDPDKPERVTGSGEIVAFASTDNRLLYYQKDYLFGPLYARALDGGAEFEVVPKVLNRAFYPGAGGVYFIRSGTGGNHEIAFWNSTTRKTISVAPLGSTTTWLGLGVSPDERFFVYSRYDRVTSDILLIDNFR